jgi:hypothetical protein
MKSWATIIWVSKNRQWFVTRQPDGEGSIFESDDGSDFEINRKLLADWTVHGGNEKAFSEEESRPSRIYIQGRLPSWQEALRLGRKWSGDLLVPN